MIYIDGQKDVLIRNISIGIIVVALFFVVNTKNIGKQNKKIQYHIAFSGYFKILCGFMAVILAISLSLPLLNSLPYTKEVVRWVEQLTHWEKKDINELKLSRYPTTSDEIIMRVQGEGPFYLRRLAYKNYYNGTWHLSDEINKGWTALSACPGEQTYPEFRQMLYDVAAGEIEIPDLDDMFASVLDKPIGVIQLKQAIIKEEESPKSYLTINGVNKMTSSEGEERNFGYNGLQEDLYVINNTNTPISQYRIYYNHYILGEDTRERLAFAHMDYTKYTRFVSQVIFELNNKMEQAEVLLANEEMDDKKREEIKANIEAYKQKVTIYQKQVEEYKRIQKDYTQIPDNVAAGIQEYARNITSNCEGDYAKAEAIWDKLKNSKEYSYKMGAKYTDSTNDPVVDFLLYGRAGICQDFASAMVLLCRSIGLAARYIDGYYTEEIDNNDYSNGISSKAEEYIVRKKNAHAFVEVYIVGYGWMLFDPTTSNNTLEGEMIETGAKGWSRVVDQTMIKEKRGFVLILVVSLVILSFRSIRIRLWGLWIANKSSAKVLGALLEKSLAYLEKRGLYKKDDETLSQFTQRLQEQGIEISAITKCYEAYLFGKQNPKAKELREAYICYLRLSENKKQKSTKQKVKKEEKDVSV